MATSFYRRSQSGAAQPPDATPGLDRCFGRILMRYGEGADAMPTITKHEC